MFYNNNRKCVKEASSDGYLLNKKKCSFTIALSLVKEATAFVTSKGKLKKKKWE